MSARAYRSWRRRDKARDQNRVAANLRRVQEVLDVHVALVERTGREPPKLKRNASLSSFGSSESEAHSCPTDTGRTKDFLGRTKDFPPCHNRYHHRHHRPWQRPC